MFLLWCMCVYLYWVFLYHKTDVLLFYCMLLCWSVSPLIVLPAIATPKWLITNKFSPPWYTVQVPERVERTRRADQWTTPRRRSDALKQEEKGKAKNWARGNEEKTAATAAKQAASAGGEAANSCKRSAWDEGARGDRVTSETTTPPECYDKIYRQWWTNTNTLVQREMFSGQSL